MKVLLVAGARPNFTKVAPIMRSLTELKHEAVLVHTGQHYDKQMSGTFFDELAIPGPIRNLEVGSGSHAVQTGRIMQAFEPVLVEINPDWVVVVGDVNSTLACALVTSKLTESLGCRLAHVEAGLRSGDWRMPEEINRVLTDRLSDLLLTPSRDAEPNLLREGIDQERIVFVGNVVIDSLMTILPQAKARRAAGRWGLKANEYAVATVHRPSNVDEPEVLRNLIEGFSAISSRIPIIFPMHPRTRQRVHDLQLELPPTIVVTEPLGYVDMLSLVADGIAVLTDSGGLQEETTVLGVGCVTLREQTERPITVVEGTNRLVRWPPTQDHIVSAFEDACAVTHSAGLSRPEGWDGFAGRRIVDALAVRS